jgi:hypothetical protein
LILFHAIQILTNFYQVMAGSFSNRLSSYSMSGRQDGGYFNFLTYESEGKSSFHGSSSQHHLHSGGSSGGGSGSVAGRLRSMSRGRSDATLPATTPRRRPSAPAPAPAPAADDDLTARLLSK